MADPANSGIYEIVNLVNGKRYVGSAIRFNSRWIYHRRDLRARKHHSPYLQASWNKYGEDSFAFRVLEGVVDKSLLISREQHYIDTLRPEYNIRPVAGSALGHRWTAEQRQRISAKRKGRRVLPIGYRHSDETRAKFRERMRMNPTFLGRHHSAEAKEKISARRQKLFASDPAAVMRLRAAITRPDVRAKKSANMAGNKLFLGRQHTEATKKILSEMFKGRAFSDESRQKMSESQKRKAPPSLETRAKMSASRSGIRNGSAITELVTIEHVNGVRLSGIPMDLRERTGISPAGMTQLMSGVQRSTKGWRLVA